MADEPKKSVPPTPGTTPSAGASPPTTSPPKTDEDKEIEKQSKPWGDRIKDLPKQK